MDSNLDSLKNTLKYLGFGNSLTLALEAKIGEGTEKFSIGATAQFDNEGSLQSKSPKDIVHYELLFSKAKIEEKYFINGFKATLEKGVTKEKISNHFLLGVGNDVTAKEAYNLLSGRSILKRVEISKKYDLQLINSQGSVLEELKTAGIQEARDYLISKSYKELDSQKHVEILDNGYLIRRLDLAGKDITPVATGKLILVHSYYDKNNATLNKAHFTIGDKQEGENIIRNILENQDQDQKTSGFRISESSGKTLLYNFDQDGQEVDISLNKKIENVWIKLSFTEKNREGNYRFERTYSNHGFDLENELNGLGIQELLNDQERESLLASLGRGNIQPATLQSGSTVYLEADPAGRKIKVYDRDFNKLVLDAEENKGVIR